MQVSKQVVGVVATAFLILFGSVCYLLGRESARRRAPVAVVTQASEPSALPAAEPPAAAAPPLPTTATPPASAPAAAAPAEAPAIAMPSRAAARDDAPALPAIRTRAADGAIGGEAAAARDYFARMQTIQTVGTGNDPNEMANKLLTASMTGDSTGFDDLIRAAQTGAERVRAITPPACCVAYHEHLLALVTDGVAMVQQIKRAMASNDAGALAALATSGASLQNRATALENDAAQIKARLGLPR